MLLPVRGAVSPVRSQQSGCNAVGRLHLPRKIAGIRRPRASPGPPALDNNPGARSPDGNTATHFAVWSQRPDIMKILLNSGAPFLMKNNFGALPIDVINCHPSSPENAQMRDMLIAKGSPVPGPPAP
ncbi:hypothetical protein [Caballeronia sp. LjRoot31]|uniref:hypothetical protein n=1 Tax=Caballeronia sp. LjRoot31 TaxID=3342324 RepID=UPI003F50A4D2